MASPSIEPNVGNFIEFLSQEPRWYTLGIFLGAPTHELREIERKYRATEGIMRCLSELYECLQRRGKSSGKSLSWERIISVLEKMDNFGLAEHVKSKTEIEADQDNVEPHPSQSPLILEAGTIKVDVPQQIQIEYESLVERLGQLRNRIKRGLRKANAELEMVQDLIEVSCCLEPLPQDQATLDNVFRRLKKPHCSILNFRVLNYLVKSLIIENRDHLLNEVTKFNALVENFKKSAKMLEIVALLKNEIIPTRGQMLVKLKVREFWSSLKMKEFETVMAEIFETLYDIMVHITVTKGCICLSWIIPDGIDTTELIPELPLEFIQIIGVISLHIGSKVIYNIEGDGCETIEAAMLQAIELKNTQAIELLLAIGCSVEVATFNADNAVTNIVNIRPVESKESSSGSSGAGGVDHVCILGHSRHVEAIVNPSSIEECSSCSLKEKMVKNLHQDNSSLRDTIEKLHHQEKIKRIDSLSSLTSCDNDFAEITEDTSNVNEQIKLKDAEITLLKRTIDELIKEKTAAEVNLAKLKKVNQATTTCNSTVMLPCRKLGIKAEMKVKVITRDNSGKELVTGGSVVRGILTCNIEECPVTDNNDGTYTVTVIPQQLGQHQLSITVNGQHIQGSPFTLNIVPERDYTNLDDKPVRIINTGIYMPKCIAFSNNGDMFVTASDHRIHVYDQSGYEKATIGSGEGSGPLQFKFPCGIDINGEIIYVAEWSGHRIHQLTTGGEFIGTFGEKGSAIGQFNVPYDVKISPADGKVYVADAYNDRVQVFNPDWSISHVIDGTVSGSFSWPKCIAFDLSGDVHISSFGSFSGITVITSNGQFVRRYGSTYLLHPSDGIAIDSSGYSLVSSLIDNSLSIYDSQGEFVRSSLVEESYCPRDVSISPVDESVWVTDTFNDRLVQII